MFLIYQIKVGLCLIAFYLLWKLLLSRETFHRFNRVALLVVMVLALMLPWIRLSLDAPASVASRMVVLDEIFVGPAGAAQPHRNASSWTVMGVMTVVYFIGMALALVWLLHSQWNLHRLLKTGRKEHLSDDITLHVLPGELSPFSYFKHIVINEQDYRDNSREILIHEQAHIDLRHSWDVMFLGLVTLFQWWNPAVWLLSNELRQVHEYEADEAVLNANVDVKQYQLLLIRKSVGNQLFSMANNLNHNSLKQRIRMMKRQRQSRWLALKALAVVPVAALLAVACGQKSEKAAEAEEPLTAVVEVPGATPESEPVAVPEDTPEVTVVGYAGDADKPAPKAATGKIYEVVEQMPRFPGGDAALMQFLSKNIKYPKEAENAKQEGRVIANFVVEEDGSVSNVKVVKSVSPLLDAEALRVLGLMPRWEPGQQNGKPVRVKYTVPITFRLQ